MSTFPEYANLDLAGIHKAVLAKWKQSHLFEQTLAARKDAEPWIFFEGPPSANGLPGIHHVMGRSLKDVFCRYKTQKGYLVDRKAGWDTHGLPVELEYLCDSLEELTLEGNLHLKVLPDEYEHLTTLKRLSLDVELLGSFNNELLSWATTLESLEFDGGKK